MERPCPECGGDLDALEPEADSVAGRFGYVCRECQLTFETDPAGGLLEVED